MKKLIALIMALSLTILFAVPSSAQVPLYRVSGGGSQPMPEIYSDFKSTFAFNVIQTDAAGNAKGTLIFNIRRPGTTLAAEIRGVVKIIYLAVDAEGDDAWMGGIIVNASGEDIYPGQNIVYHVQDNGVGSKATGYDRSSSLHSFSEGPSAALGMPNLTLEHDWINGNITISTQKARK